MLAILLSWSTLTLGQQSNDDPYVSVRMSQIEMANKIHLLYREALRDNEINEDIISSLNARINVLEKININNLKVISDSDKIEDEMSSIIDVHQKQQNYLKHRLARSKLTCIGLGILSSALVAVVLIK